jgi:RNA-directed DNA polymerase
MKRHRDLWPQVTSFENLFLSARQAQKGKRFRDNVLDFNYHLEQNLETLQTQLLNQSYQPGPYRTFEIFDPKPRMISAAPYRDRVVHHALCRVIAPLLDRSLIPDTYANRPGYGTHRALKRFVEFARSSRYVLQCDIQKYFPSIDHEVLKAQVRRKIKCPETLWLAETIIDHSNPQESIFHGFENESDRRRGLPIGNLTSQFLANTYLDGFDHFIKQNLQIRKYLRYVDDFALFSDDRDQLAEARQMLEAYLAQLYLKIHPVKSQLFETRLGTNFVGFRVMPDRIRVRNDNLRRSRLRLAQRLVEHRQGKIDRVSLDRSFESWMAHLQHGDTWQLRSRLGIIWDQRLAKL